MSNQGNMIPPKETNKTLITYTKEIEVCELSAKEFIIIFLNSVNLKKQKEKVQQRNKN